jgi:hypothetical protein
MAGRLAAVHGPQAEADVGSMQEDFRSLRENVANVVEVPEGGQATRFFRIVRGHEIHDGLDGRLASKLGRHFEESAHFRRRIHVGR